MITHSVLFTWKPDIPEGQVEIVCDGLSQLPASVPSIREFRFGSNVGAAPGADFAVVATFDDVEGWREYDANEFHGLVRTRDIVPWVAARTVIQFES